MGREEDIEKEQYSNMVNHNSMLLCFEGWIKYIEGFSRGLQTTKTVDAGEVFTCVGEIMDYMKTLRKDLLSILQHCEEILEKNEEIEEENSQLKHQLELIQNGMLLEVQPVENVEEQKEQKEEE